MKKIFKFLAYTFVSSIIIFGAVLVVYRQNIFEYLNSINNLSRTAETMIDNIKPGDELVGDSLNLAIIDNPKFKKMKLTEVDLTGLELSTSTTSTEGGEGESGPAPTFEVGNSNPFKAF